MSNTPDADEYFLNELRLRIRAMGNLKHPYLTPLYKTLKEELRPLGYWKPRARGKAFDKGGKHVS